MVPPAIVLELTRARDADDPFEFRFECQEYLVRAAGGTYRTITVPWDADLLAELTSVLTSSDVAQQTGDRLRDLLAPADFVTTSRAASEATLEQPVVITIRAAAAELFSLPWELVTLGTSGRHLAEMPGCLVRYAWPGAAWIPAAIDDTPPRVVVAWSAAGGAVPAAEHQTAIVAACAAAGLDLEPARDILPNVTCERLAAALAVPGRPASVLHILCHGRATASQRGLVWSDDEGCEAVIDGAALRVLLAPHAAHLRLVVLCACSSGDPGAFGNHLGSVAQAIHRAGIACVVASRHPLSIAGANVLARTLYPALLAGHDSLERALLRVRTALCARPERDWLALQLYATDDATDTRPIALRPYRGLLTFEAAHGGLFAGRDQEIATLIARIAASATTPGGGLQVVLGTSGSGKSSLLRAGVVPRLVSAEERPWRVAVLRPAERGGDPIATLAAALAATLERPVQADPAALLAHIPDDQRLLVLVDQFEEVFRLDPEPARRFAGLLWRLSGDVRVVVVLTMRVDVLDRCCELDLGDPDVRFDQIIYDERTRILLRPPGPEALRAIVEVPARTVGLTLEPGLAERLLADADGQPGALPLLEHALDELWRRRDGRTLTFAAYAAIGGLGGALSRSADAVIDGMDAHEQVLARRLLTALIELDDELKPRGRRQVALAELQPDVVVERVRFERVVARLVGSRLIVEAAQTLDLAHEALIRGWPRLRGWLDEDRDLLREVARLREWHDEWRALADRPDEQRAFLDAKDRLAEIRRLAVRHPELISGPLREFIADSEWLADAEGQRSVRQKNTLSVGLGLTGCTYALATAPLESAWAPVLVAALMLVTALIWEQSLAERVVLDPILDYTTNGLLHIAALGVAFAGFHGELAAGDPHVTLAFIALSSIRVWTMAAIFRNVPQARRWVLHGLGPLLGLVMLLVGLVAPAPAPVVWWAAAVVAEHLATSTIHLGRITTSPPTLSEGSFVATLGRMQDITVVGTTSIILMGLGASTVDIPLLVALCLAIVVYAASGRSLRFSAKFSPLALRRAVWHNAMIAIVVAMILHAAVSFQMLQSGATERLRWGWAAALTTLLLGVIACGLAIEPERRRRDQNLELRVTLVQLPLPALITALTTDPFVWTVVQCAFLFTFPLLFFRWHQTGTHVQMNR